MSTSKVPPATEIAPNNAAGSAKLAARLLSEGAIAEAEVVILRALDFAPKDSRLLRLLSDVALRSSNRSAARSVIEEAVAVNPGDIRAWRRIIEMMQQADDTVGARAAAVRAMEKNPGEIQILRAFVELALSEGDIAAAQAAAEDALRQKPWLSGPRILLASLLERQGDQQSAADMLEDGLEEEPDCVPLLQELAELAGRHGDPEGARRLAERACGIDPAELAPVLRFSRLLERQGKMDEALAEIEAVRERHGGHPGFLLRLSDLARARGDLAEARERAGEALAAAPAQPAMHLHVAGLALEAGDHAAARHALAQGLDGGGAAPALKPGLLRRFAVLYHRLGDGPAALSLLGRAEAQDPADTLNPLLACGILREAGQPAGAKAALERAVGTRPVRSKLLRSMGDLAVGLDELPLALELVERAIRLAPGERSNHLQLAALLLAREDDAGARAVLEAAVARIPRDPQLLRMLSNLALRQGDLARATQIAEALVVLAPGDVAGHMRIIRMHQSAGDRVQARAAVEAALAATPDHPTLLRCRAELAFVAGEYDLALRDMERAVALEPGAVANHVRRLRYLEARGDMAAVEAALEAACRDIPESDVFPRRLCLLLARRGDFGQARSRAEAAAAAEPGEPEHRIFLAELHGMAKDIPALSAIAADFLAAGGLSPSQSGRLAAAATDGGAPELAAAVLRQAVDGAADPARAYLDLATLEAAQGEASRAVATLQLALSQDPLSAGVLSDASQLAARLGLSERAVELARRAAEGGGDAVLFVRWAALQRMQGDAAGGIATLERAAALAGDQPQAISMLVREARFAARPDLAAGALERAHARDAGNEKILILLASHRAAIQDKSGAAALIEAAFERRDLSVFAAVALGWLAVELGRHTMGCLFARRVVDLAGDDVLKRVEAAGILQWAGDNSGARAEIDAALAIAPTNAGLLRRASAVIGRTGDAARALHLARAAVAADPTDAAAHLRLMQVADRSEAGGIADAARAALPGHVRILTAWARHAFEQGDREGARAALLEAMQTDAEDAGAHILLCELEAADGRSALAAFHYRKASAGRPGDRRLARLAKLLEDQRGEAARR
ncbi:tetratricopeptide repeat protein [Roseococcus sp.]|uniref:tetratricopeptide repeat protein n=1 Tax=Roseococcus sp. TaxID=2109646 RepID=UPI003BACCB67